MRDPFNTYDDIISPELFAFVKDIVGKSEEMIAKNFSDDCICTAPLIPNVLTVITAHSEFSKYWIMTKNDIDALDDITEGLYNIICFSGKVLPSGTNTVAAQKIKGLIKHQIKLTICRHALNFVDVDKVIDRLWDEGWMRRIQDYWAESGIRKIGEIVTVMYTAIFFDESISTSMLDSGLLVTCATEFFQSASKEYLLKCRDASTVEYRTCHELITTLVLDAILTSSYDLIEELNVYDRQSAIAGLYLFIKDGSAFVQNLMKLAIETGIRLKV